MSTIPLTRIDILRRSIGVSFIRYLQKFSLSMQRVVHSQYDESGHLKSGSVSSYSEGGIATVPILRTFSHTAFRQHLDNVQEPIAPALNQYCHEFCDWLVDQMIAGKIVHPGRNEKGEAVFVTDLPFNERRRRLWLYRKLQEWHAPLPPSTSDENTPLNGNGLRLT